MKLRTMLFGTAVSVLASTTLANAVEKHKSATESTKFKIEVNKSVKKVSPKAKKIIVAKNACSAFGDDFFTIPGTSSCIKIYGKVMATAINGSADDLTIFERQKHTDVTNEGRLGVESLTASALGNIHTRFEVRGKLGMGKGYANDGVNGNHLNATIHFAYAEVGGLRFGVDESIFNYWANNFGGVEHDGALNPLAGSTVDAISYTASNKKGLSAIVGLERYQHVVVPPHVANILNKQTDNASLVAGIKYQQPWGDLIGVAAYDANFKTSSAKIRLDKNINSQFNVFALAAVKSFKDPYKKINDDSFERLNALSPYGDWDGKWEAIAGATYTINPKLAFNTQLGYTQAKTSSAAASLVYTIAKGFTITPEISYMAWDDTTKVNLNRNSVTLAKNRLQGKHQVTGLIKLAYKF